MENKLRVIVEDTLYEVLATKGLTDEKMLEIFKSLKENEHIYFDEQTDRLIFLSQKQDEILEGCNIDISNAIRNLYDSIEWFYESYDFGIKEYERLLSWDWEDVYDGIECYINDPESSEQIFNEIKNKGLHSYIDELINVHVAEMIKIKIEEIKKRADSLQIDKF